MTNEEFKPIAFQARSYQTSRQDYYRVYSDVKNFVEVEASNAAEAFSKSGLEQAHLIVRESLILTRNILDGTMLLPKDEREAVDTKRRDHEAALAVANARRQTLIEISQKEMNNPQLSENSENPNLMPSASGELPVMENVGMNESATPAPVTPKKPETPAEDVELDSDDVKRLLGETQ